MKKTSNTPNQSSLIPIEYKTFLDFIQHNESTWRNDLIFSAADASNESFLESINTLVNSCYRGEISTLGWTTEHHLLEGTRTTVSLLKELIENPQTEINVLTHPDFPKLAIACYEYKVQSIDDAYLGMLSVFPLIQQSGLGKKMILHAKEKAKKAQKKRLLITVLNSRAELINYYERIGFKKTNLEYAFHQDPRCGEPKEELRLVEFSLDLTE